MTNRNTTLADSIAHVPHFAAFDMLVKKRFSDMELDKLLIYIIDTVDAKAIPFLADQFDVLGFKGFRLAHTEADQREIIKRSIELHRFKGTLWAVKEALVSIGYGDVEIVEHVGHWARFRVMVDIGTHPINAQEIADVVAMITEYKNARSRLVDLSYTLDLGDDTVDIDATDFNVNAAAIDDDGVTPGGSKLHDGALLRDGSQNYSQDSDTLTINII